MVALIFKIDVSRNTNCDNLVGFNNQVKIYCKILNFL